MLLVQSCCCVSKSSYLQRNLVLQTLRFALNMNKYELLKPHKNCSILLSATRLFIEFNIHLKKRAHLKVFFCMFLHPKGIINVIRIFLLVLYKILHKPICTVLERVLVVAANISLL